MTEAYCNYIVFKYLVQNGHGDVAKAMASICDIQPFKCDTLEQILQANKEKTKTNSNNQKPHVKQPLRNGNEKVIDLLVVTYHVTDIFNFKMQKKLLK